MGINNIAGKLVVDLDAIPVEGVRDVKLHLEEGVATAVTGSNSIGFLTCYSGQLGGGIRAILCSTEGEDKCICIVARSHGRIVSQLDLGDLTRQCSSVKQNGGVAILISHLNAIAVVTDLSQIQSDTLNGSCAGVIHLVCIKLQRVLR